MALENYVSNIYSIPIILPLYTKSNTNCIVLKGPSTTQQLITLQYHYKQNQQTCTEEHLQAEAHSMQIRKEEEYIYSKLIHNYFKTWKLESIQNTIKVVACNYKVDG